MLVSRQSDAGTGDAKRGPHNGLPNGPRARTGRLMLETAIRLMQGGATPSVSEVAEAAGVSRATAYRYFPSQAALVGAVVDQALGPILTWTPSSPDPARRVAELIDAGLPRIDAFEATFKAALKLSLEQWAKGRAGTLGEEPEFKRGHRIELLKDALSPLKGKLRPKKIDRLAQALSLVFGVEVLTVLKDIWGLNGKETQSVAQWAASALVRAAVEEDAETKLKAAKQS
jgi:AcrR family transcriptional regulator